MQHRTTPGTTPYPPRVIERQKNVVLPGRGRVKSLQFGAPPPLHRVAVFSRTVFEPTTEPGRRPRIYYAARRFTMGQKEK